MYKIIRCFLFMLSAEKAHYVAMNGLKLICSLPFGKKVIQNWYKPTKPQTVKAFGLTFKNNIGLAAGFDKNATYLSALEALGFGHIEIGTVTPLPQDGNEKPRLFRLKDDKALINRMGFNNDGMEKIANRLNQWRNSNPNTSLKIGGNIGKNKNTPNELAYTDYVKCFLQLNNYVDYFVVNVSSPNTPGLRALQDKESLLKIFTMLQSENEKLINPKPILLKIAPDLSWEQVDDVIALVQEIKIPALVVSNTTLDRSNLSAKGKQLSEQYGAGGLSGMPLKQKATTLIEYIHNKSNGAITIIGSGGIFTKSDAIEKNKAGAQLLQVWTGFIYQGPSIVKSIIN
jgi:dihydroorotate dehydrogenase